MVVDGADVEVEVTYPKVIAALALFVDENHLPTHARLSIPGMHREEIPRNFCPSSKLGESLSCRSCA
jgi:hypothetical protein